MKNIQTFEVFINENYDNVLFEKKTLAPKNIIDFFNGDKKGANDLKKWSFKIKELEFKFKDLEYYSGDTYMPLFFNGERDRTWDYIRLTCNGKDFQIVEVNGIKIGFVAFTYSLNQFLPEKGEEWRVNYLPLNTKDCSIDMIEQQVRDCRNAGAEFIICSVHAGNAYQVYPSEVTVKLFQKIFETCGVDVIAGGHPHNMQPWRSYTFKDPNSGKEKQGFAVYSLGDFIAYDIYTWCHVTAFVKLEIGKNQQLYKKRLLIISYHFIQKVVSLLPVKN
jgi:hypothetical protein